ncbi:MAG: M48 family metalloprotease [Syntrophaceae bacterium]|nr:M48 family metalloprotease [Syntrophaceae bacterium]
MKRYIRKTFFPLGLAGLLLWTLSCAVNPVTGKQELMLLSEADEIQLGRQTDSQVVQEYGIYEDPKLTAYLNDICQRLGKVSHRPNLTYHFKLLDVSVVNAFAVPGGYVYLTRGILASLNSEAELAGVLGHEIGHIAARHSAKQYSKAQLAQIGLGVGMIFTEKAPLLSELAQLGVGMLFLRFSRDNEREADDLGVEYSIKAGYDASQLASFFETLERMNPGSDRTGLPAWFSTHPNPEDRLQAVRARAKEWGQKLGVRELKLNREPYLKTIDGLVFGEDPRQGYVLDHVFYHPGLRFQFPVPANWKLTNTPSRVQMVSEKEDAIILFSLAAGQSSGEAAKTFVSKTKASVIRSEATAVNGLSSHRLISDIQSQSGVVRVISYFIQKEKYIFAFHGLSARTVFPRYENLFDRHMRQFKELSDPKRIDVKPDRIRIRSAGVSETLEKLLRSFGVPNEKLKETALLNGRKLNEVIPANTLLKIVEKGR